VNYNINYIMAIISQYEYEIKMIKKNISEKTQYLNLPEDIIEEINKILYDWEIKFHNFSGSILYIKKKKLVQDID